METGGKSDGELQGAVTPKRFGARPSSRAPGRSPRNCPAAFLDCKFRLNKQATPRVGVGRSRCKWALFCGAGSLSIAVADGEAVFYGATVDCATEDPSLPVARARP